MYKFLLLFLFISSVIFSSQKVFIYYPLDEKYLVKASKLVGVYGVENKFGNPAYKTNYESFFKKCEYRVFTRIRYVYCFQENDKKKLKHHYGVYGKLIEKLKNYKTFYVTYYKNVILDLYDKKSLFIRSLRTRFEVFLNENQEIIFYSKISRLSSSNNPPLNYINFSLFFNIAIYLHKNNIHFTLKDIKENNYNMIFKDKDFQKEYNALHKKIDSYIILVNYDFHEKDFKVKRTFGVIIEKSTRSIRYLYIKDIYVNKNLEK